LNLLLIGAAINVSATFTAWAGFRKPGVPFWTCAPVWQANQYLAPAGAAIWIGGCIIGVASMAVHFIGQSG
jgi:hypothetical protein